MKIHTMLNGEDVAAEEAELRSPQTQGFRRAAITYFDKWQIEVLRRLGEVLSVKPEAVRKARADAKANAEAYAKAKQDQAYWDWANGGEGRAGLEGEVGAADQSNMLPPGFQAKMLKLPKGRPYYYSLTQCFYCSSVLSNTHHILVC